MDRKKTGKPVFGVLPWVNHRIPNEDSVVIQSRLWPKLILPKPPRCWWCVPHISNFTLVDALFQVDGLGVDFVEHQEIWLPTKP